MIYPFEQILRETIEEDFNSQRIGVEPPEHRAAKTYAEQFIDAAAEEAEYTVRGYETAQSRILKLKKHLK